MKTARVRWVENLKFIADAPSGHSILLDGPPESGSDNSAVRPGELTLLALGGCTSVDLVLILKKMRVNFDSLETVVEAESADTPPKVWIRLHIKYIIKGKGIDEFKVRKAIALSQDKYCSVAAMLRKSAEITHEVEITDR
jgi:putative redox protein